MKLRNDRILVFGGGSGIGKAIAKRFCDAGAKVLITGRNEEKLKNAAEEINSKNLYCKVFDIQRNSYVDGPGIRTTVFFKGCNLKCRWCHNPESQSFEKQILFYQNKCTRCGRCKDLTVDDENFVCFNDAK